MFRRVVRDVLHGLEPIVRVSKQDDNEGILKIIVGKFLLLFDNIPPQRLHRRPVVSHNTKQVRRIVLGPMLVVDESILYVRVWETIRKILSEESRSTMAFS